MRISRRKALALLAYLVVAGRPLARDGLLALFWPEEAPVVARTNLRRDLSYIRKKIGSATVPGDHLQLSFDPQAGLWVDVLHFRDLVGIVAAHPHVTGTLCAGCLTRLEEAVAGYGADFMTGFGLPAAPEFDDWQYYQSTTLRHELITTLKKLLAAHIGAGNYDAALPHARRWLSLDQMHEPAQRQLIKLLAWSGLHEAALQQFETSRLLLQTELDIEPEGTTLELVAEIQERTLAAPVESAGIAAASAKVEVAAESALTYLTRRHNLPAPPTPFIGREQELADISDLLADPKRNLVTIVAAGGMGKSRLALALAERSLEGKCYPNGIFFVPLAHLSDADHIPAAMAEAFDFPLESDGPHRRTPRERVVDYLSDKKLLLVLDNFEHLLAGAELVNDILRSAPLVQIVVTSRVRLKLRAEQLYVIQGLEFPEWESPEDAAEYTAVQLFLQSARRINSDFALKRNDLSYLSRICRLVEGMPLALELAAGWVDTLSLEVIAGEIQSNLDFLETELSDVPQRQRSIRAVFDTTWDRLDENEITVLPQLAVFYGGFTRAAAQAITGTSLRALAGLVSKSLLSYDRKSDRYQLHQLLHQYAANKLAEEGEASLARSHERHSIFYCQALANWGTALKGEGQVEALAELEVDLENARAAFKWAMGSAGFDRLGQALFTMGTFHKWRSRFEGGDALFTRLIVALKDSNTHSAKSLLADALIWQGVFQRELGNPELAMETVSVGMKLTKNPDTLGLGSVRQGQFWLNRDNANASEAFRMGVTYAHQTRNRWLEALAKEGLGAALLRLGDYSAAQEMLEQSLSIRQSVCDWHGVTNVAEIFSTLARFRATHDKAHRYALISLDASRRLGNPLSIALALSNLAVVTMWLEHGRFAEAYRLQSESLEMCATLHARYYQCLGHFRQGLFSTNLGDNDEANRQFAQAEKIAEAIEFRHVLAVARYYRTLLNWSLQARKPAERNLSHSSVLSHRLGTFSLLCLPLSYLAYSRRQQIGDEEVKGLLTTLLYYCQAHEFYAVAVNISVLPVLLMLVAAAEPAQNQDSSEVARLATELLTMLSRSPPYSATIRYHPATVAIRAWAEPQQIAMMMPATASEIAHDSPRIIALLLEELPKLGWPAPQPFDVAEAFALVGIDEVEFD